MRANNCTITMQNLHKYFSLSRFGLKNLYSEPNNTPFLCLFSSVSSLVQNQPSSFSNFLIETLAFSEPQAISISNLFPPTKTLQKPHSVVQFLRQLGFSKTQVQSSIRIKPNMLFSDIDKTLKPKLQFFQDLGLTGPDLCKFISTNPDVLFYSLERTLIPCVDIIKKTLVNDKNNQDLIRVLQRIRILQRSHGFSNKSVLRLKFNIAFLESCGIVGSQLSMLLKRRPSLMFRREQSLKNIVSRVSDMGFPIGSRMLVRAVDMVSCTSVETFNTKIEFFRTFGFSADECMEMFRRAPTLLGISEGKLKLGMEFFLNEVKFEKSKLVRWPICLLFSMEERIIPRYKVLQVVKCKKLLKKEPSLATALGFSEEKFLEKFISRFRDDAEELLVAYKGKSLDS